LFKKGIPPQKKGLAARNKSLLSAQKKRHQSALRQGKDFLFCHWRTGRVKKRKTYEDGGKREGLVRPHGQTIAGPPLLSPRRKVVGNGQGIGQGKKAEDGMGRKVNTGACVAEETRCRQKGEGDDFGGKKALFK